MVTPWQNERPTNSQLQYILYLQKNRKDLPPFKGRTRGDAAEYISHYKQKIIHKEVLYTDADE